ncbi:MAG: molybdopterin-dependent oxidoreductase [Bacteroidales bacterium]|nr:molybdopterin-dependent oxidoreductase [Bacteroidales bacterium]
MTTYPTICPRDCYDTCALLATVDENGKVVSVKADDRNPITKNFTCARANKDHERIYTNRVEYPTVKETGKSVRKTWDEATNLVVAKLNDTIKNHGPESVLLLDYAGNMGLLTTGYPRRLWNKIGATQTDGALCSKTGHIAINLHYGDSYGIKPTELITKDLIVFWGFNAFVTSPHFWKIANQAKNDNTAKIVVIDPVRTKSADHADLWISPFPGTDTALAYGIMNYLIQNNLINEKFIAKNTLGFNSLIKEAKKYTIERVEKITGVKSSDIEKLAKLYAALPASATMIGISLQKASQGIQPVRAISFIPAILGIHRGFFYSNGNSFYFDEDYITGKKLSDNQSKIVEQVALADLVSRGNFKFIFVNSMNPADTLPNVNLFRKGLLRDDVFVVVHDTHLSKTTEYADVILPAPSYLEKEDLIVPWGHNYIRFSEKVIEPLFESKTEVRLMHELSKKMGLLDKWLFADPKSELSKAFENSIKDKFTLFKSKYYMLKLRTKNRKKYHTSSGKIEFYSSIAEKSGIYPLPEYIYNKPIDDEFILLTGANLKYTNSQFKDIYGEIPSYILINPKDAKQLKINNEEMIILSNNLGEVKIKAIISDDVKEKTLWAPRLAEGEGSVPLNSLTESTPQNIGGGVKFNSTFVKIFKTK